MFALLTLLYWLPELAFVLAGLLVSWLLVFRLRRVAAGRALAAMAIPQGLVDLVLKGLVFPLIRLASRIAQPYSAGGEVRAAAYFAVGVVVILFSGHVARMVSAWLSTNDSTDVLLAKRWPAWGLRALGTVYVVLALGVWLVGR